MDFKPNGNWVVLPDPSKKKTDSGIILDEKPAKSITTNILEILAAGPQCHFAKVGDTVIVHHNVFRRWHNVKGKEKNSRSYFNENTYLIKEDQIFLYKTNNKWKAAKGYCFVQPIKQKDSFNQDLEQKCIGIIRYTDGEFDKEDLVGFTPFSEYEFIIDGQRLYRVMNKFITIKYEYQGDEEAYNPSWAQSG